MKLSIIIPAYNEEERLPLSLRKINKWVKKRRISSEIIVVDDGSTDMMLAKLKALEKKFKNLKVISYESNRGKGCAVRRGILVAKGEIIIFTDADLSTPIREADKLMVEIKRGADLAVASRFMRGSKILGTASTFRNFLATVYTIMGIRTLILYGPKDTQCGFKAFTQKAAKKIFKNIKSDTALFDLEVFLLAKKNNFKIVEVPVIWKYNPDSKLIYNLPKAIMIWVELLRLKYLYKIIFPVKIKT